MKALAIEGAKIIGSPLCASFGQVLSNVLGYIIIALGCTLIADVIAVYTHVVLPLIAPPGTFANTALFVSMCCISFLVVFNYISAMTIPAGDLSTELHVPVGDRVPRGVRFCNTCRMIKPPRTHHCGMCGSCVPKMDHHCPWINACVGNANQRYFFMFLLSLLIGTGFCGGQMFYAFMVDQDTLHREILDGTLVIFTMILCAAIFVAMMCFVGWYLYLLLTNQTAIEYQINRAEGARYRGGYTGKSVPLRNPYDLGRWRNVLDVFLTDGDSFLVQFHHRGPSGLRAFVVLVWALLPSWTPLANDGSSFTRWDEDMV